MAADPFTGSLIFDLRQRLVDCRVTRIYRARLPECLLGLLVLAPIQSGIPAAHVAAEPAVGNLRAHRCQRFGGPLMVRVQGHRFAIGGFGGAQLPGLACLVAGFDPFDQLRQDFHPGCQRLDFRILWRDQRGQFRRGVCRDLAKGSDRCVAVFQRLAQLVLAGHLQRLDRGQGLLVTVQRGRVLAIAVLLVARFDQFQRPLKIHGRP